MNLVKFGSHGMVRTTEKDVFAQKEVALADSQPKAKFLTFVRNDKLCCHFALRPKGGVSCAPNHLVSLNY